MPQRSRQRSRALALALPALLAGLAGACRTHESAATTVADSSLRAPDGSPVPGGDAGRSIRRGEAILASTRDSLPAHVGNALRCYSCHLNRGQQPGALPLTGVFARFPQYRSRSASVQQLQDRVNDCLERSLNGTALPFDDPAMRDIITYLAFISRGAKVGPGEAEALPKVSRGDTTAGRDVFLARCSRCHGVDGAGTAVYPPLWGERSFNIGAGMARLRTAMAFIRRNMPRDSAGVLTDQEALDVAAYVTSRPRPDFAGKEHDWPRGEAPADLPYRVDAGRPQRP